MNLERLYNSTSTRREFFRGAAVLGSAALLSLLEKSAHKNIPQAVTEQVIPEEAIPAPPPPIADPTPKSPSPELIDYEDLMKEFDRLYGAYRKPITFDYPSSQVIPDGYALLKNSSDGTNISLTKQRLVAKDATMIVIRSFETEKTTLRFIKDDVPGRVGRYQGYSERFIYRFYENQMPFKYNANIFYDNVPFHSANQDFLVRHQTLDNSELLVVRKLLDGAQPVSNMPVGRGDTYFNPIKF